MDRWHNAAESHVSRRQDVPKAFMPALALLYNSPDNEAAHALTFYLAALVDLDYSIDCITTAAFPVSYSEAYMTAFKHCLHVGLSIEEQAAVRRALHPFLQE